MPAVATALLAAALAALAAVAPGAAAIGSAPAANQTAVHLIFSSHLDLGFTDMDNAVIDLHFYTHWPRAIQLARWFDRHGGGDRFRYLTHSWLLSLYFDCPASLGITCPAADERAEVADAVRRGWITWHAAPFNPNYEMFDSDTLGFALNLTRDVDAALGARPKTVVSLRDVPGLTRGVVPVMAAHGVRALTVGVNGFSAPPGVPKRTPFIWRDEESGAQILAMWHEGGYGGWHNNTHADDRRDCIKAPGFGHALCVSWNDDNAGPPASPAEVQKIYAAVRASWPGARVFASTLEDYVDALAEAAPGLDLPVVTEEIGDTWVYGSACDPLRIAQYRAALRARARCVRDPDCDSESPAFYRFSRLIIKVAEHTWGLAFLQTIGDVANYTNAYLRQRLEDLEGEAGYARAVESWQRQRDYVKWAVEELPPGHPVRAEYESDARQRLSALADAALTAANPAAAPGGHEAARLPLPPRPAEPEAAAGPGAGAGWLAAAARWLGLAAGLGRDGPIARAAVSRRLRAAGPEGVGVGGGSAGGPGGNDNPHLVFKSAHWEFELDPWAGGLSRLARLYPDGSGGLRPGNDWAADAQSGPQDGGDSSSGGGGGGGSGPPRVPPARFLQLQYNVYNETDFDPIWDNYAFIHPVWTGDFGKLNLSASSTLQAQAVPFLVDVIRVQSNSSGLVVQLQYEFPHRLVSEAGAPAGATLTLRSPSDSPALRIDLAWRNKTATRLPEASWLRFTPGRGAVGEGSWRMHKIGSAVDPSHIVLNGSHSIHCVSEEGVTADSPDGGERLRIRPHDAPLLALGEPRPFPNPNEGPDMERGVSACLHNNVWGTNYAEWVPYSQEDASLVFRFTIEAEELPAPAPSAAEAAPAHSQPAPAADEAAAAEELDGAAPAGAAPAFRVELPLAAPAPQVGGASAR
ncbi:hypothetical protein Rsub_00430 [Raphidocelis subcapitata]|uniref:Glycoside hydrolase family 38 N-terminal domain-containing protein n=1 Tax=Raphidocelis subcapitata TaxID=307507 RepID=A0A2V0NKZ5_9CHLO|nr:hypothetical protein Rsub_00430 [Raphidocelis subcapitata]|eukprot:GBF87719.1 hypothetical protein Rsub_00430 [Raphidocelis subcapitata]